MYVQRDISWSVILRFAWFHVIVFIAWATIVTLSYYLLQGRGIDIRIPFLPLSTIGIAVAFYIGFKNNSSYDRFWEARKMWGAIVNYSRTWGNQVLSFVTTKHAQKQISQEELNQIHRTLIYRHIAWINVLKLQLRKPNPYRQKMPKTVDKLSIESPGQSHWCSEVYPLIPQEEYQDVIQSSNVATQILRLQGQHLRQLTEDEGLVDDFRHMELMRALEECYNFQGACERIKNTPFPRQYAYFSKIFCSIFIFLLPFGMVGEFAKFGDGMIWLTIPFCVLISWIFMTMELVGDNSEDPFENFINDVPMNAICRTIEIDLREMLKEKDIPPKIEPSNGILM